MKMKCDSEEIKVGQKKTPLDLMKKYEDSLAMLNGFAGSVADVVMMITPTGEILQQFGNYNKYFPNLCEPMGLNIADILPAYLYKQFIIALETLCKTDENFTFETEMFIDEQRYILEVAMALVVGKEIVSIKIVDITNKCVAERKIEMVYEYQKRSRFFNSILTGGYTQEQQEKLLSVYGVECRKPLVCYMISNAVSGGKNNNLTLSIGEWMIEKGHGWTWSSNFGIGLLMQYPNDEDEIKQIAMMLKEGIETRFHGVKIYLGIAYCETVNFKQLYYDALAALMRAIDKNNAFAIGNKSEDGLYEILVHSFEQMDIERFIEQVLGKIKQNDSKNGGGLLETLEELINGQSVKSAAAKLFVHPNTVQWRKQKLEELLEMPLDNADVRTQIILALKMMKIKNFIKNNKEAF